MASRHVDVNERRLRPVYGIVLTFLHLKRLKFPRRMNIWLWCVVFTDALDSMNNKQAIQLADKILKKQKDLHCAKVTVIFIYKQLTIISTIDFYLW